MPVVIGFHGGMFVMGSAMHIPRAQISWLRRAGFLVVAPEYRLCPHVDVWTGPVQDCVHLYDWVVSGGLQDGLRQFGINVDVDKISLLGHSVGATLAMVMVSLGMTPLTSELYGFAAAKGCVVVLSVPTVHGSMDRTATSITDYARFPTRAHRPRVCAQVV